MERPDPKRKEGGGTIKLGVVGAGSWGTMHIRAYAQHPLVDLVAICDLDETRARQAANQYGVPSVFTRVDEMLASGLDGLLNTRLILAAEQSAETGMPVDLVS